MKKTNWDLFRNKKVSSHQGYFKNVKNESIFRTPENYGGRVGVVGSGRGVTQQKFEANNASYQQKKYEGSKGHLYKIN